MQANMTSTSRTHFPTNVKVDIDSDTFYLDQAVAQSTSRANRFVLERTLLPSMNPNSVFLLACARLHALNERGVAELAGKLSRGDFLALLNCFLQDVFSPETIDDMANALNDDHCDDLDPDAEVHLAVTLREMSDLQRFALADLLERCWHGQSDEASPLFVAERLGLVFAE